MKRNRIYGPRSASEGNNWDDGSCNVSLNSLDVMTMLYKLTAMTWTHGKTGKYNSGGLVFRYRRLHLASTGINLCLVSRLNRHWFPGCIVTKFTKSWVALNIQPQDISVATGATTHKWHLLNRHEYTPIQKILYISKTVTSRPPSKFFYQLDLDFWLGHVLDNKVTYNHIFR
jgi:hypothetical protein